MKVMTWVPDDKSKDQDRFLSEKQIERILDAREASMASNSFIVFLSIIVDFVLYFIASYGKISFVPAIVLTCATILFAFIFQALAPFGANSATTFAGYIRTHSCKELLADKSFYALTYYPVFRKELLKAQNAPIKVDDLSKFCSTYGVYEMREKVREMVKNVDQLSAYKGKIVNLQINLKNHLMVIQGDSDIIKSIKQSVKNKLNQLDEVYAQVVDEEKRWLKQIGDLESKSEVFRQVYLLTKLEVDFQATDALICEAKAYLEILSESSQSLSQSVKNFELNHKELLAFSVTQ